MPPEGRARVCPVPDPRALSHTGRRPQIYSEWVKVTPSSSPNSSLSGLSHPRTRYSLERLLRWISVLHIHSPAESCFSRSVSWASAEFSLCLMWVNAPCHGLDLGVSPRRCATCQGSAPGPSPSHTVAILYLLSSRHIRKTESLYLCGFAVCERAFYMALVVKIPPANAGDVRDVGSIPGSGRSPGGEQDNPLQCSCLESHGQKSLVGCSP